MMTHEGQVDRIFGQRVGNRRLFDREVHTVAVQRRLNFASPADTSGLAGRLKVAFPGPDQRQPFLPPAVVEVTGPVARRTGIDQVAAVHLQPAHLQAEQLRVVTQCTEKGYSHKSPVNPVLACANRRQRVDDNESMSRKASRDACFICATQKARRCIFIYGGAALLVCMLLVFVPGRRAVVMASVESPVCRQMEEQAQVWLTGRIGQWLKSAAGTPWRQVKLAPVSVTSAPCTPPPEGCQCCSFQTKASMPLGQLWIRARCLPGDTPLSPAARQWHQRFKASVQGTLTVLYAGTRLAPGDVVTSARTYAAPTALDKLRQGFFTRADALANLVARQYINPDSLLTPALLRRPELVKSGMPVSIRLVRSQMLISAAGTAVESGKQGDIIRVRRKTDKLAEGPLIHCRVLGQDLVEPVEP